MSDLNTPHDLVEDTLPNGDGAPKNAAPMTSSSEVVALQRLYETSARLNAAEDEQAIVEVVRDALQGENINAVTLTLFNSGNRETASHYTVAGAWRADGFSLRGRVGPVTEIPMIEQFSANSMTVISDMNTDARVDDVTRTFFTQQNIHSLVGVPLTVAGRWLGDISIATDSAYEYMPSTLRFLSVTVDQIAHIVDRFALVRQTERRARELQTVAEVSASVAKNLNLDELLQNVAELVKERFNLYHAHIYLLDAKENLLKLVAGAGEVGRVMVASKRAIPLNSPRSLVAAAAREKRGQTVNDVTQNLSFLPHPLLPDTRAEMAIPMLIGDEVIGVLDVQDSEINRFTDDDVRVQTTLAAQIAVAIQNARAYQAAEEARKEAQLIFNNSIDMLGSADFEGHFLTLNPAWENVLGYPHEEMLHKPFIEFVHPDDVQTTLDQASKMYEGQRAISFVNRYRTNDGTYRWISWNSTSDLENQRINFVARDVTEQKEAIDEIARNSVLMRSIIDATPDWIFTKDREFRYTMVNEGFAKSMQRTPDEVVGKTDIELGFPEEIVFGDFDKGIIGFRNDDLFVLNSGEEIHNPYDPAKTADGSVVVFDTRKIPLRDTKGEIYGVLGFAHDITEVSRRANEMQTVAQVAGQAAQNLDLSTLLPAVANLVKDRFDLYHAHIYLLDEATEELKLTAGAGEVGRVMVARGRSIALDAEKSLIANAARRKHGVIANDVTLDENFLAHPLLPDTRAEMAVPLMIGEKVLGVLDVQSNVANRFTDNDIQIQTVLAEQIAVAVQNARLFAETTKRATELQTVSELATETASSLNTDELLQDVVDLVKERFDLYHAHIYLYDEESNSLKLAAGAGEKGRLMKERGHRIPMTAANSVVARTARDRQGIIVEDVQDFDYFLPNPMLPDTRAEMAVPLIASNKLIGVLDTQSSQVGRFTHEDLNIKTILGGQIAIAIEKARAYVEIDIRPSANVRRLNVYARLIASSHSSLLT